MPQWQFKVWTMTLNKTWHGWSEKWCFVIGYYFVLSYSWFAVMQPVQMLVLITVGIAAFICACVVHTASYAVWCSSVSSVMLTVKRICVDFFHEVIPYLPPPTKLKFSCCISVPFEYDLLKRNYFPSKFLKRNYFKADHYFSEIRHFSHLHAPWFSTKRFDFLRPYSTQARGRRWRRL